MTLGLRWLKFNAVGGVGIAVQLAALWLFKSGFGWGLEFATAAAVEVAVLHNFFWHERWTWNDRSGGWRARLRRLARFNITTGLLSIVSNVILTRLLVERFSIPYGAANLAAIALTSVLNFLAAEYLVFRK
ncbi:MAG: GtrA family protein [Bryobacterales bacterium]|nr:GtrA family protein [Bryobacterales bacterium]